MCACRGRIVVSGLGKSGIVGQKLSASLASVGLPSFFLHAGEAMHGDLGRIAADDVLLCLSHSGRSPELQEVARYGRQAGASVVALTCANSSPLADIAHLCLDYGEVDEACPMNLIPSSSTTAMLVMGDALTLCAAQLLGMSARRFAQSHPGGSLGQRLAHVSAVMRQGPRLARVSCQDSVQHTAQILAQTPEAPTAAAVVTAAGELRGVFGWSDLARLLAEPGADVHQPVGPQARLAPLVLPAELSQAEAARRLVAAAAQVAVVVCPAGRPLGLLEARDVGAAVPEAAAASLSADRREVREVPEAPWGG